MNIVMSTSMMIRISSLIKNDSMKQLIERNMVWLVLLLILCVKCYDYLVPSTSWDLNRATGWSWDVKNAIWYMFFSSNLVYLSGYAITKLYKRYHLFYWCLAHLFVMFVLLIWPLSTRSIEFTYTFNIASAVLFVLNIITSKPIAARE